MSVKFYAVKNGRKPGIYESWAECFEQVNGFSNAIYKSFTSKLEAEIFMGSEKVTSKRINDSHSVIAYVDGSFDSRSKYYSYGLVLFVNGQVITQKEKFNDVNLVAMRNVAGEIIGATEAMEYCIKNGYSSLIIYYDYSGIEKWCSGEWKANKIGTIAYKKYYDSIKDKLEVDFRKVKSHSGDIYNDLADKLAKEVLGLI
ncbi:ribonuclease H1 domain-containing protein [Turicibacter sanguinis]|uniref:ribonuclease H1 domain-containing protein n=1 Tax=Turicibacter sanguinis TaxID=154288 RepID=UPI0006C17198|nr:ribonuclease H family protein [Turicibacter sanguinis]CUN11095.1 Ribonuclease H [Turicibacter sanguinis]